MSEKDQEKKGNPEELMRQKISGVFSTQKVERIGTGSTMRKSISKMYYFAKEVEGQEVQIQPLNTNYVPAGPKKEIPRDEFLAKYNPEPEFYVKTVYPKMRELNQTVARAEEHRRQGAAYSAEFEYSKALEVDEENVRANFGLGLTYLSRGENAKANDIFERLVHLDAAFETEHKHLFNEFGINLRKSGMHEQAVDYYARALEMTQDDENLHYNMARAFWERGQLGQCVKHLQAALKLNPDHETANEFLQFLQSKVPAEKLQNVKDSKLQPGKDQKKQPAPSSDAGGGEENGQGAPDLSLKL
ncbi:MAG: tetratricopeptide repeat protein [Desulfovibrionaceae bacterium]